MKCRVTAGIFFLLAVLTGALWARSLSWEDCVRIRVSENSGFIVAGGNSALLVIVETTKRSLTRGVSMWYSTRLDAEIVEPWEFGIFEKLPSGFLFRIHYGAIVLTFLLPGVAFLFIRREN